MHPHPSQLGLNKDSESTLPAAPHPGVWMLRGEGGDMGKSQRSPWQPSPPAGLHPSPTVWVFFGHKTPLSPNSE